MPAPAAIIDLVARFRANLDSYKRGLYNETQVRREFIDPFFDALGWDVANRQGYAEAYKDVVHEEAIKVGGGTKAPDYGFRIGGTRKFFVEAKKPSVDIKGDVHPAYQLRRYAWSAKLPLSILTDFEEFAVYDCRVKPDKGDKPSAARVMYLTFDQYADRWEEIAGVFARDAILKGSFDKYAEAKGGKRGTAEVDAAFLAEIERWRDLLAHTIALRNAALSQRELNFAVQQTIDRIIFLRICEDRGIEPYSTLLGLVNGAEVYQRLLLRFRHADARYNSGLFYFETEKGRGDVPDTLTPRLEIDDKVLADILKNLYYPDSPYEFSVLPLDILGQVYEQFLGKVIRLTPGHRAVVEEKPEVRKAGGVFYTPTYIVAAIVRQTLGKLLAGLTLRQVAGLAPRGGRKAFPMRVADIACGSGSFLLGAYQYLLDWYLAQYLADGAEKWATGRAPRLYQTARGEWRLTIVERKRILLDHIYGVDIDPQAVEVTKLSLLLKVLEGEDEQTIGQQLALFPERALPDLGRNIKCGNSLVGPDFYDGQQMALLDDEAVLRINPFDWSRKDGFPQVMADGGFDVVIGNPPYIRPHNIAPDIKRLLWANYRTFVAKSDMYACFIERALNLTRPGGLLSFIVPQTWTSLESFTTLREIMIQKAKVQKLVQLPKKVFADATVETCIFVLEKSDNAADNDAAEIVVERLDSDGVCVLIRRFPQRAIAEAYLHNFQLHATGTGRSIIEKTKQCGQALSSFVEFAYGFKTADDEKYIHPSKQYPESEPFIRSAALKRYTHDEPAEYVWYVPHHMIRNRKTARPGEAARFEAAKIIVGRMGKSLFATYDPGGLYVKDAMLLLSNGNRHSLLFLLGLINSRLLTYYYREFFVTIDVLKNALLSLPIRTIDFTSPADVARHDRMVGLVERMLDLHKKLAAEGAPHVVTVLQRQVEATDREIDRLVYELYGLTAEEIAVVEGSGR